MSPKKTPSTIAHERLLTEVELELMNIIWSLGTTTIKEVVSHLSKKRSLAYTTVATVFKVLEKKGFLNCQKSTHAHVFMPAVSKSEYESTCLDHVVANVFDGEPLALVQRLLVANKLQQQDIQAIEKALKQLSLDENLTGIE
ncbi:Penicillinase repressor [Legionella quinlivanii]|uniref:Penicillinase repressor n=1 Tax=Legionella quinlivanii TaxID=45073 RepID=A0A0W0XKZ1_9GAMM|nr:BlaI/MecI/CopY family transcriptional regulator [Legionella quinlivanii]KTD45228.1 Penicillinase repressor [Legionella quinlivanii]SEG04524.1 Predicted transcriptional regulator [Legionella quinlivanii DSM 21216]STY11472.1 transcriptional regulators [Legionella quinlivanii]